jgi:hypothetical protein
VVSDLAERLDVDDLPRLKRYYQRLEGGTLDPGAVDQRVWDALRELFVTNVRAIVRPVTTQTGDSAMAYYRRGGPAPQLDRYSAMLRPTLSAGAPAREAPERDELDRLFLGED